MKIAFVMLSKTSPSSKSLIIKLPIHTDRTNRQAPVSTLQLSNEMQFSDGP